MLDARHEIGVDGQNDARESLVDTGDIILLYYPGLSSIIQTGLIFEANANTIKSEDNTCHLLTV